MSRGKLCSIIIPCFQCKKYLGYTVDSALAQTYPSMEILLVDDGSQDGTWELMRELAKKDPRIRIFQNPKNLGVAETRNFAFRQAQGEYVAFLDSDDLWAPDKLEKQISLLSQTGCDFCYSSYSFLDAENRPTGHPYLVPKTCSLPQLLKENFICCSSVVLRRELVLSHPMNPNYFHEDFVLWIDLLKNGYRGCGHPEPLVQYRIFAGGRSQNKVKAAHNRWVIYRAHLGLGLFSSCRYFLSYAWNGVRKHLSTR